MRYLDEIGNKYHKLTIVAYKGKKVYGKYNEYMVLCKCDCGNERITSLKSVVGGTIKSCGCVTYFQGKTYKRSSRSKHPLISLWNRIRYRCTNPSHPDYADYGGRGIRVCDEWLYDSDAFIRYVETLPDYGEENRTLDRINNDGNYEPANVRWADNRTQACNRRRRRTNKSGYTGISYNKEKNKFTAIISMNGESLYLGAYKKIKEALMVRNKFIKDNNLKQAIQVYSKAKLTQK